MFGYKEQNTQMKMIGMLINIIIYPYFIRNESCSCSRQ